MNDGLIANLPGSPRGVVQCLEVLRPLIPHAVRVLRGEPEGHPSAKPVATKSAIATIDKISFLMTPPSLCEAHPMIEWRLDKTGLA